MICPTRRTDPAMLLEYALGRLGPQESGMVARHASECDDCAAALLEYSSVSDALDLWEAPPVSMHFNRQLWERVERAASASWYARVAQWFRLHSLKPAIPLTAMALVIAVGFLLDHPSEMVHPSPTTRVSAAEADQAERTLDDLQLLRQFDAAVAAPRAPKAM